MSRETITRETAIDKLNVSNSNHRYDVDSVRVLRYDSGRMQNCTLICECRALISGTSLQQLIDKHETHFKKCPGPKEGGSSTSLQMGQV